VIAVVEHQIDRLHHRRLPFACLLAGRDLAQLPIGDQNILCARQTPFHRAWLDEKGHAPPRRCRSRRPDERRLRAVRQRWMTAREHHAQEILRRIVVGRRHQISGFERDLPVPVAYLSQPQDIQSATLGYREQPRRWVRRQALCPRLQGCKSCTPKIRARYATSRPDSSRNRTVRACSSSAIMTVDVPLA
jgi:hypothetical protein